MISLVGKLSSYGRFFFDFVEAKPVAIPPSGPAKEIVLALLVSNMLVDFWGDIYEPNSDIRVTEPTLCKFESRFFLEASGCGDPSFILAL